VGEFECPDGNLYSVAVLRDALSMPPSGRFSTVQHPAAQVQVSGDVEYGTAPDHLGNSVSLGLDLYRPPGPATGQLRPLVILVHGGGFTRGDKSTMADEARSYARRGFVAASIKYRLESRIDSDPSLFLPTVVNAIDDAMESVRWLRANAATYGIDPGRVVALGSSAGGAIALGLAVINDPTPGGPLTAYPTTLEAAISTGAHLTPAVESGILTSSADDAPVMLFHFDTDSNNGNTDEYAFQTCAAVRESGNTYDFTTQPGSGHTTSLSAGAPWWTSEIGPYLWHHLDLKASLEPTP